VAAADKLLELTMRQATGAGTHMKGARFVQVATTPDGESIIESVLE
jgi:hypothetical protein